MTPHDRIVRLLERWESVDGDDNAQWRRARRSVAVSFIAEELGVAEAALDAATVDYLAWLADWDAPIIVDTIAYIELLAGRHGPLVGDGPPDLGWLAQWDEPAVAATVRLAQLARQADGSGGPPGGTGPPAGGAA